MRNARAAVVHVAVLWTIGLATVLAQGQAPLHDSQYSSHEYEARIGWGHSSLRHMLQFGGLVEARHVVPIHHDPSHTDADLDRLMNDAIEAVRPRFRVTPGREGMAAR